MIVDELEPGEGDSPAGSSRVREIVARTFPGRGASQCRDAGADALRDCERGLAIRLRQTAHGTCRRRLRSVPNPVSTSPHSSTTVRCCWGLSAAPYPGPPRASGRRSTTEDADREAGAAVLAEQFEAPTRSYSPSCVSTFEGSRFSAPGSPWPQLQQQRAPFSRFGRGSRAS
jgi:hypothetical protein